VDAGLERDLRSMAREAQELSGRMSRLYGSAQGWVGPLSADQASQQAFLTDMLATLTAQWGALEARLPG